MVVAVAFVRSAEREKVAESRRGKRIGGVRAGDEGEVIIYE